MTGLGLLFDIIIVVVIIVGLVAMVNIAQMVEWRTAGMKVPGSNPGSGMTKQIDRFHDLARLSSEYFNQS